jgi:hypothetical protein
MFSGSLIRRVEQTLVPSLVNYCLDCFSEIYLPSHDVMHHIRTWSFAKNLASSIELSYDKQTIENLAMACLLHDTGMSVTLDKEHGPAGENIAEQYISRQGLNRTCFSEALAAIRYHDNKEYQDIGKDETLKPKSILQLLSLADDLDALGTVGVFRYYEIYLLRGMNPSAIPGRVMENLDKRYPRLKRLLDHLPGWTEELKDRYNKIYRFYLDLDKAYISSPVNSENGGPIEVIRIFDHRIREPRLSLMESKGNIMKHPMGSYARQFFTGFFLELDQNPLKS